MAFTSSSMARAETVFLPESHHQQYESFGLFIDNQTEILYRNAGRAWASLGISAALFQIDTASSSGQVVIESSVNTAFRLSDGLSPETADARIALLWESRISRDWLWSIGYNHASGHVNDDSLDGGELAPLNVGIESIPVRFIYQGSPYFRPGFTLQPVYGSEPSVKTFQSNEFIEIFPSRHSDKPKRGTPYIALGSEQYGRNSLEASGHFQIGVYFGNHIKAVHETGLRLCVGGYTGPDPRLKYYYYKNTHAQFIYAGAILDL